jgi:hypothetical protein
MVSGGKPRVQRPLILAIVTGLWIALTALAPPRCDDLSGRAVRCGTAGAVLVGWKSSREMLAAQEAGAPAELSSTQVFGLVCFIGGLFALFALLPDFEAGDGGGWDRQEDDEI